MSKSVPFRAKRLAVLLCAAFGAALASVPAVAQDAEVQKKIDALQRQIDELKALVQKAPAAQAAPAAGAPVTQAEVDGWRKFFSSVPTGEAPATSARTGITVYGRVDLGYEANDDGTVQRTVLNSYSSRLGFKGTRQLGSGLTGILQIETGIAPDDSANSGALASRESYVGLRGAAWGTVKAGRHDSPFKDLEGEAAPMWGAGDAMEVIIHGKGTSRAAGATWANFHTRFGNVLQYESPRLVGLQLKAAYSTDEVNGATGTVRKPARAMSVDWDGGPWFAGVAYQSTRSFNGSGLDLTGFKAVASVAMADFSAGLMWSRIDNDAGKKTNNYLVSGTYKLSPVVLKANFGKSSATAGGAADGLSMWAVEVDWPFDKNTALYGYYTKIANDANARGRFEAGENTYTPAAGKDPGVFAVGLRFNF